MPKRALEFSSAAEFEWRPVEGVVGAFEKVLSMDDVTGDCTRLLRLERGADLTVMGTVRHEFWEEVWILAGAVYDVALGRTFSAGMYACRPPGMPHGPWTSAEGCLVFEVRYRTKN